MLPVVEASILHADLDSFYAAVEQRDDPALRNRPVIVGHGVVLTASYEARARGVRTAMGGRQARLLCPDAVTVEPRFDAYTAASRAVFEVFEQTTPLVEGISIDEAFLDVGGLRRLVGPAEQIAAELRRRVREEVGLPISVGVAPNKFLAKVASAVAKPDGLLVVPIGGEEAFLHPLPVERLWGCGPKTTEKLHARGIFRVGEVAEMAEPALVAMLGPASGRHLHALAHYRDPRPVRGGRRRRSIGSQRALGHRRRSRAELDAILLELVDRVTRRLRNADRVGRTVTLRLRFDDFTRVTRSHTVGTPTANTGILLEALRSLLDEAYPMIHERGITLLGIAVANLDDDTAVQLSLPFDGRTSGDLDVALDAVREKYGNSAVSRATLLGRDIRPQMPILPD